MRGLWGARDGLGVWTPLRFIRKVCGPVARGNRAREICSGALVLRRPRVVKLVGDLALYSSRKRGIKTVDVFSFTCRSAYGCGDHCDRTSGKRGAAYDCCV